MRWGKLPISIVALVSFLATPLMATVIHVPADKPSIQAGIDAAANGDTVLVAPGTYVENIDFKGKAITVKSSGSSRITTIDGGNPANPDFGSVVIFNSGEGPGSILDGFILTNGTGTNNSGSFKGGGIYCRSTSPTIKNCTITGNTASLVAGGIYCSTSSSPYIINNIIYGNTSKTGGGILYSDNSNPIINNNTIIGNIATKDGGGVYCWLNSSGSFCNNILWNNSASTGPELYIGTSGNPASITISYSDVEGGKSSVYVAPGCTLNWGPGMIDAYPFFVGPAKGDFHLTYTSPCKDTGDISASIELYDFEGDPRIVGGFPDMGADEFYRHLYWTGYATPGGSVTVNVIDDPNTYPVLLLISIGLLNPPIFLPKHGYWHLQFPVYGPISLGPIQSNGVNKLTIPIIASAPSPLTIYTQALSGNDLTNLSVLEIE